MPDRTTATLPHRADNRTMRREQIYAAYFRVFGTSLQDDLPHLRRILRSYVRQGKFTGPIAVDRSTVTLEERNFARIAFLSLITMGWDLKGDPLEERQVIDVGEAEDVNAALAAANPTDTDLD